MNTHEGYSFPNHALAIAANFYMFEKFNLVAALADSGKFLLAAQKFRRATVTDYIISLHGDEMSKGSSKYIGKLRCVLTLKHFTVDSKCFTGGTHTYFLLLLGKRSNFLGTKFVIYDAQPSHAGDKMMKSRSTRLVASKQVLPVVPAGNYPVAHISYELNMLGSR